MIAMELMGEGQRSLLCEVTQDSSILPRDPNAQVLVLIYILFLVSLGVSAVRLFSGSRFPGSSAVDA
jgi:hypothetical protein